MGDIPLTKGFDSEVFCLNNSSAGYAHLWFPTYELINKYIMGSNFASAFSCN